MRDPVSMPGRGRDVLLVVLAVALVFRLGFAALTGDTYDYDEFVLLLLARDFAHGAQPYLQFWFFHPPGVLVLLRLLAPVTSVWWPAARLLMVLADTLTAGLVCYVARRLWGPRESLAAGLLYATSPLALVSAVRVGQDSLVTLFGLGGLVLLVASERRVTAAGAGACLAVALWIKYPAAIFVPAYVALAPRRSIVWAPVAALGFLVLILPFHTAWPAFYQDTVSFQQTRWRMALGPRLETAVIWWVGVNVVAMVGLMMRRPPPWLIVGFFTGAIFVFTAQVYYHYFVPVVPFAALLGAPAMLRLGDRMVSVALPIAGAITLGWAALLNFGGPSPLFVTAAHLSAIAPTVRLLDARDARTTPVLADRFEYAYLAKRPALLHYFWNVGPLVRSPFLEHAVSRAGAVVLSYGASSGYPVGFVAYLDKHYPHIRTHANTVWIVR